MITTTKAVARPGNSKVALGIGIVLIGANLRAPITSLGPVLPDVQRALHLDGAAAGLLNSLPLVLFAVLSLVAPWSAPRFDRTGGIADKA